MSTDWEEYQEKIKDQMRKIYSDVVIDHAMNPRNIGNIEYADGYARLTGSCGDTMQIWLKVSNDIIKEATFTTDGCGTTIVAGSMTTELATEKSVTQVLAIGQKEILNALNGLPEESQHCALLAASTLRKAVMNYLTIKKEPWKKAYRGY